MSSLVLVANAIYAAAPGLSSSSMTLSFNLDGTTSGASCPGSSGSANANMVAGGTGQITATYPCTLAVYGASFSGCSLQTQITEVIQ